MTNSSARSRDRPSWNAGSEAGEALVLSYPRDCQSYSVDSHGICDSDRAGEAWSLSQSLLSALATQTDMLDACGEALKASILAKIPLGRFGAAQEIAPIAVLLASEEGSFFVGQTISPNGGDVLR
jgi:NAD(P)-dependent dehydrogenase (short-subunit alcohol dehydrogenase family)